MDDLRARAEEIADFAVGERHNHRMYERLADVALTELRAAVEAEREALVERAVNLLLDWVDMDEHTVCAFKAAIRRRTDNG